MPRFMILLFLGSILASRGTTGQQVRDPALRRELLEMARADEQVRDALLSTLSPDQPMDSLAVAQANIFDAANVKRMKQIIKEHGWPGKTLVGEDGSNAAFLLVQNAAEDTAFQREVLALLRRAFRLGEVAGQDLAVMTDRVRLKEGLKQLYGTQAKPVADSLVVDPIENEELVDNRRASLGLIPLSEYLAVLRQVYGLKER